MAARRWGATAHSRLGGLPPSELNANIVWDSSANNAPAVFKTDFLAAAGYGALELYVKRSFRRAKSGIRDQMPNLKLMANESVFGSAFRPICCASVGLIN
jgi:hypothetical protein